MTRKLPLLASPLLALLLTLFATGVPAHADDREVLGVIFGEQHVDGSAYDVHRAAVGMTPTERFDWLTRWLLPTGSHISLRVEMAFAPTDAAPIVGDEPASLIVSPMLDLVDVASELGRLDELRERVTRRSHDELKQQAVLALIELAADRPEAAVPHVDRVLELTSHFPVETPTSELGNAETEAAAGVSAVPAALAAEPADAALLLMSRAMSIPQLREAAGVFLDRCNDWVKSTYQRTPKQRHVAAMAEQLRAADAARAESVGLQDAVKSLTQWRLASRTTAATRGTGCPPSQWMTRRGHVETVSNHEMDYLYFNTPLRGDFDVECDVSVSSWRAIGLLTAGYCIGCRYSLDGFDSGTFRYSNPISQFTPPISRVKHWLHYRTTVRSGVMTTYFNGRPIYQRRVQAEHDPWVAIRNFPRNYGMLRNLRISGAPSIPEAIRLADDPGLIQWCSYFGETVGNAGSDWSLHDGELHGVATVSEIEFSNAGNEREVGVQESLLRYHRPMCEDGLISYDFYYEPGKTLTHPALDRMALLLLPDGVKLHWVTDGRHDRTGLSPSNITGEPQHRRGPERLPLKPNDWNQLHLRLTGDVVNLVLNGVAVFERPVEATNQRTFGLFYYSDRHAARVRNVVWRGDWPTSLPSVTEQELAAPDDPLLAHDAKELPARFEHDFREDGLPVDRFTVIRGNVGSHVKAVPDGLLATRPGTGGYLNATVAPAIEIAGDFDVTVEYEQFDAAAAVNGIATVSLMAMLKNSTSDEFAILRRHARKSADAVEEMAQCVVVQRPPEGERRNYFSTTSMEETSGSLRLIRRGDRIYYLTAEGDSPHFQLRGEHLIAADAVAADGLRLMTQIYQKGGFVSVVWKRLTIRAEALSGRAINGRDAELTELNQQRDALPERFSHDFRKLPPTDALFYQWSIPGQWSEQTNGWLITAAGADNWIASGVTPHVQIVGDFDARVRFRPEQLAQPKAGKHSQCYFQLEAPDAVRTQLSLMFTKDSNGNTTSGAQARERNADESYNYRTIGQLSVVLADSLRICRRGRNLTAVVSDVATGLELVVARYEFSDQPIEARNLRFMVHTGGAGLVSDVVLESFEIRAEKILQPVMAEAIPARTPIPVKPQPPKGLLDRVLDYFK